MKTLREMMDTIDGVDEGWRGGLSGEPDVVKTRKKNPDPKIEAWQGLVAIAERGAGLDPRVQAYLKQIAKALKPEGYDPLGESEDPIQKVEELFKNR